jgi:hypothetical protein
VTANHVVVGREDAVLTITINRPEKKNALTHTMYGAIADALTSAGGDSSVRVVLITGTADAFTPGNDLGDFLKAAPAVGEWRGLRVTLSADIPNHSPVQDFYFGEDFLTRRQDYILDVAGGCNVANYALEMTPASGLKIPAKRRAYLCDERYHVFSDRLLIRIDFSNINYS